MREIVDRHFADNWVIALYMGFTVDLSTAWEPYKAARLALSNTLQTNNAKRLVGLYSTSVGALCSEVKQFLVEGVLTEEYVLDNIPVLLNCLRNCNASIR